MPLLSSTYKYISLRHSSSTLPFSSFKTYPLRKRPRRANTQPQPAKILCGRIFKPLASSSSCSEEMAINFNVPEVNPIFTSFLQQFPLFSQVYVLSIFLFFSSISLIPQTQQLSDKIVIPTDQPHIQCLGLMGNLDPTNMINAETNRIPFRAENFSLDLWKDTF